MLQYFVDYLPFMDSPDELHQSTIMRIKKRDHLPGDTIMGILTFSFNTELEIIPDNVGNGNINNFGHQYFSF